MATDYATVEELAANLGIDDDDDDVILQRVLTSASRAVDNHCRRRFWKDSTPVARYFAACGRGAVKVDDIADSTVTIETDDDDDGTHETAWTSADFVLLPRNAEADGEPWRRIRSSSTSALWFPRGEGRVKVTATYGWPAVPSAVKDATLFQAARLYHRKDTPFAVAEVAQGETAMRLLSSLDPDVITLLAEYRREAVLVA